MRLMKERTFDRCDAFGMMDMGGHSPSLMGFLLKKLAPEQEMTLAALRCDTIVFAAVTR